MTKTDMHTAQVTSLLEFVELVETLEILQGLSIFRGQAKKGNLLPNIARPDPCINTASTEKEMLNQLLLLATPHLPQVATTTMLERMVVAQHYGMKTRLLDWSTNPLVALYFACADRKDGDVYVYALDADNYLHENPYESDPFLLNSTKIFQPRLNNPRIAAQDGWFTLHAFSEKSRKWVALEKHREIKHRLAEIKIPKDSRENIIKSLNRHGVSVRTVFPDLDGVCRYVNFRHGYE